jgi:flagellar hook-length control protein FliK
MTALNAASPLLAPPASMGVRPGPAGSRPAEAGEAQAADFGARLAEATRQARDTQDTPPARRPAPEAAAAPDARPGAQARGAEADAEDANVEPEEGSARNAGGRARSARRGTSPADPDADATAASDLARLLSRAAEPATATTTATATTAATHSATATATATSTTAATAAGAQAGTSREPGRAALARVTGAGSSPDASGETVTAAARSSSHSLTRPGADARRDAADELRNRLGGRLEPATQAATQAANGPAAEAMALAAGQTPPVPSAQAAAGASGIGTSTLAPVAGLLGPGAAPGAASGPDLLSRGASPGEAVPHFTLSPALDSPTFAPALGLQLSVLARDGIEQARMQINPQEMGPIGVQLTVTGQQVQVEFVSEHARTRQVLEQSLQQLASALGDAGFTMTGGGVFQQGRGGREGQPDERLASRPGVTEQPNTSDPQRDPASGQRPRVQRGLVDLYA